MSLLSYNALVDLVQDGVINAPLGHINGASIDITMGKDILIEKMTPKSAIIDLKSKQSLEMRRYHIWGDGFRLYPGQFILATSQETFNLPRNIACEYKLKSSLARSGLQHMLAGWCDPGWTNSKLTLELKNVTQNQTLLLKPEMKIGQMIFFECEPVPDKHSYANTGQYNGQATVTENKGVR
jgi:dCTP deaminase